MFLRVFCVLSLLIGTTSAASAQATERLERRDQLLGFEAVGRLESAGGQCTAALIERDVVLTAAHCVHGLAGTLRFKTGYRHGAAIATRNATDVVIAQGYLEAAARGDLIGKTANDVALVRLASPIYETGATPYAIARAPRAGAPLTLVSYGQGRMEALTVERGCNLNTLYRDGVVGMDCSATFGSSGAPVFTQVNGYPKIFSIVSGGTEVETLGVELSVIVPKLMQTLRNKRALSPVSKGARRLSVGDRSQGGIKFHRPSGS